MITGKYIFPTQIVVFNQLNKELHFWLTNLHSNISKEQMKEAVLRIYDLREKAGRMYGMAYIETVTEANSKAVRALSKEEGFDMGKVMEELLHDRIVEIKQEGIKEGIKEGVEKGRVGLLAELVRDGVLTMAEAAKKMGISEAAFKKVAVL